MANPRLITKAIVISVFILLFSTSAPSIGQNVAGVPEQAETNSDMKEKLKIIRDFAESICGTHSDVSERARYILSGEGEVSLVGLVKSLVGAQLGCGLECMKERYGVSQ
ncbi:MAG: hypothetical protein HQK57_08360, partial [Deltaproteobacteria bacterium]|nr:hypothetical protein [Deltaproteobacteria bacterium]